MRVCKRHAKARKNQGGYSMWEQACLESSELGLKASVTPRDLGTRWPVKPRVIYKV